MHGTSHNECPFSDTMTSWKHITLYEDKRDQFFLLSLKRPLPCGDRTSLECLGERERESCERSGRQCTRPQRGLCASRLSVWSGQDFRSAGQLTLIDGFYRNIFPSLRLSNEDEGKRKRGEEVRSERAIERARSKG